eukprot:scaffold433_cov257-Pinguiococcus_pyrenoidosus.AAC.25
MQLHKRHKLTRRGSPSFHQGSSCLIFTSAQTSMARTPENPPVRCLCAQSIAPEHRPAPAFLKVVTRYCQGKHSKLRSAAVWRTFVHPGP